MTKFSNKQIAIGLVLAILVLIFIAFFSNQAKPEFELNKFKQFGEETHAQFIQMKKETSDDSFNYTGQMIDDYLNDSIKKSIREDIEWISLKEDLIYSKLMAEEDNEKIKEYYKQELSTMVLMAYVISINLQVFENKDYFYEDLNSIADALFIAEEIQPGEYLHDSVFQALEKTNELRGEDVQKESVKLMNEFWEYRKQKLFNALEKEDGFDAFIESQKIIILGYLLEFA